MATFQLKSYRWERTSLLLEFDERTPISTRDSFIVRGTTFIPSQDAAPRPYEVTMANAVVLDGTHARLRFMLADKGREIRPGNYKLLVRHYGANYGISADAGLVHPGTADFKHDDMLLYTKTASMYEVIPALVDGQLHVQVGSKGFPTSFGYSARKNLRNDFGAFARSLVNWCAAGAFYFFKKVFRFKENKILFTSDSRSDLSGNMEPLYRRMEARGITQDHKVVFSFKPAKDKGDSRGIGSYIRLAFHLATSGTVFCDDYQPYLYHVRYDKRARLVQLWHACGAFKTVGFGRIGTLDAVATYTNDHRTYTDVIVASDHDVPVYAEAFGLPTKVVKPLGIPRHDWLLDRSWQEEKRRVFHESFPGAEGKQVIVFAPTFRGSGKTSAHYEFDRMDFGKLALFCRENGYFFIFKMHPFITQKPPIPAGCEDVFADGSSIREINDILPSTDILITDYSSVVYEAALLNIPTLYFAYDLEEYVSSRSFYEPYETFVSGKIVREFDELLDAIRTRDFEPEKLEAFRQKNFKYLDGGACDRIIDRIVLGQTPEDAAKAPSPAFSPEDVEVVSLSQSAAAVNAQLEATEKPLVLFVDDKARYGDDYIPGVLEAFSKNPEIGMASGLIRNSKNGLLGNEMNTTTPRIYHDASMSFAQARVLPYGGIYRVSVIREAGLRFDEELAYCRDELFALQYSEAAPKSARVNGFPYRCGIVLDEQSQKTPQADDKRWYFDSTLPLLQRLQRPDGTLSKIAQYGLLYLAIQRFKSNQGSLVKMCFESPEESAEYVSQVGEVMRHVSDEVLFCRAEGVKWERYKKIYLAQLRHPETPLAFDIKATPTDAYLYLEGTDSRAEANRIGEQHFTVMGLDYGHDEKGQLGLKVVLRLARCFPPEDFKIVFTSTCAGKTTEAEATCTEQLAGIVTFFDRDAARQDAWKAFIPLETGAKQTIGVYAQFGVMRYRKDIEFDRKCWQNKLRTGAKGSYWAFEGMIARSVDGEVVVEPATAPKLAAAEAMAQHAVEEAAKVAAAEAAKKPKSKALARKAAQLEDASRWRKMFHDQRKAFEGRRIWCYYDKSYKSGDNAEYAIRYANAQGDGIEKYFFIDPDTPDGKRMVKEGYRVMKPGTDEAALLALNAELIFMTHVPPYTKLGFGANHLPYLKDLMHAKVVRMYHGFPITRSASYAQVANDAAAVVIGTEYERELYTNADNGFAPEQVIDSGMPRYDDLVSDSHRQLLFAPTWRPSLCGKSIGGGVSAYNPDFVNSRYYQTYNRVLNDPKFLETARKTGYKAKMFLHPKLSAQTVDFKSNDVVESLSCTADMDYVTIMRQSDLMVTDYSSVQYDFGYMRKPVVYFHDPALPYWRMVNFDYGNIGLGEICTSADQLVDVLCAYMENDCALKPEYQERIERFFIHDDHDAARRLYEACRAMFG